MRTQLLAVFLLAIAPSVFAKEPELHTWEFTGSANVSFSGNHVSGTTYEGQRLGDGGNTQTNTVS